MHRMRTHGANQDRTGEPRSSGQKKKRCGQDQVELLFDGQGPYVEQWLCLCGSIEIAGLLPERNVSNEQYRPYELSFEFIQLDFRQEYGRKYCHYKKRRIGGRKKSFCTAIVEIVERERPICEACGNNFGDQKPRYDEEHIDSQVPSLHGSNTGMVKEDNENGETAKCLNICSVLRLGRVLQVGQGTHLCGRLRRLYGSARRSARPGCSYLTLKTSLPRKWRDWLSLCAATASDSWKSVTSGARRAPAA